jgi:hypothetical protein
MSKPLGLLLNLNQDPNSVDNWAIVLNGVCLNVIVSTYNQILPASVNYDYCVDVSMGKQFVNPGWLYNAGSNTFSNPAPPPPGPTNPQIAQTDFDSIISDIQQIAQDIQSSNINTSDLSTGYFMATNSDNVGLGQPLLNLMQLIYNFAVQGG